MLVEANALFLTDIPARRRAWSSRYRQSYAFDSRNSCFGAVRSTPTFVSLNVTAHYTLSRVADSVAGAASHRSRRPRVPDIRSLFLGFHYSLAKLPDTPMRRARRRQPHRLFLRPSAGTSRPTIAAFRSSAYVNRWRLEKKDPAPRCPSPSEPIVYWIDRNVPERYRGAIRDGMLEWNKAFERIGFKDAIRWRSSRTTPTSTLPTSGTRRSAG